MFCDSFLADVTLFLSRPVRLRCRSHLQRPASVAGVLGDGLMNEMNELMNIVIRCGLPLSPQQSVTLPMEFPRDRRSAVHAWIVDVCVF